MRLCLLLFLLASTSILADSSKKAGLEDPNARSRWIQSTYENTNVPAPDDFYIRQQRLSNSLPNAPEGLYAKGSQISSQTWMHAGPNNIGGRTRAVEYDRTNPNILISGGVSGGIWRSIDGGKSWVQTTGIHEVASVTAILQDPRPGKNNIWYCAGGEYYGSTVTNNIGSVYRGDGILKSTDNGLTWQKYGNAADGLPQEYSMPDHIYRLAIDPSNLDEDIIFAACVGGIITLSEDGTKLTFTLDLENFYDANMASDILITPSGKYFATLSSKSRYLNYETTHSGIFYSEDGQNWENITPDFLQPNYRVIMAYSESNDSLIYFYSSNIRELSATCDPNMSGCISIFKLNCSNDKFEWTDLTDNMPTFESKNPYNKIEPQMNYCMGLSVSPIDTNIVIIGGTNCFVSYNGFTSKEDALWIGGYNEEFDFNTWTDTSITIQERYTRLIQNKKPTGGWDFHWFKFNPDNPKEVISASDHGLHKLPDISKDAPKEWGDLNNGFYTTQYYDCAINHHKSGDNIIIGGVQDNGVLANYYSDTEFQKCWIGDGVETYIMENNSIVVSSQEGMILRLDLYNGQVYNGTLLDLPNDEKYGVQFLTNFAVNPYTEKGMVVPTNKLIAYCPDITMAEAYKTFQYHFIDNLNATCTKYLSADVDGVLIGTQNKNLYKITDLSKDNFTYDVIDLPDYVTGNYVADIWTDPQDSDHFIAIVSEYLSLGMLETYDNGETWQDHGGNLEEFPDGTGAGHSFRCYEKLVYEGDTLHLLGTSDGLFATHTLEGENTIWTREGANTIGKAVIQDIEVRELDGRIVVATHGNGLFKTNYSTSVEDFNGQNLGFVVSEVYPNPASNQINFVVNSDNASFVEAKLMDMNGREIANIISEDFAGTKRIRYNITDLNTGTYFLHISDGNHYVTKKVNVVR